MSGPFEQFANTWLPQLRTGARIAFEHAQISEPGGTHCDVADRFAVSLGLKPIGFNWELLDSAGRLDQRRSAVSQITQALSHDIINPTRPWLADDSAQACARAFLALFDSAQKTIVSNRYDGLWNPISGSASEWGFVGFDTARIALLLIAEP